MSTNYYARIIPTNKRKKELHDAIEADVFHLVKELTEEIYGPITYQRWNGKGIVGGIVHLGKRSCGWKFLWNPNVFVERHGHSKDTPSGTRAWVDEPSTAKYIYPLTKKGIKDFIDREDVLIYDEYNELQDKEEFWKMALEWGNDRENGGWDAASYEKWEKEQGNKHNLYPVTGELTDLLRREGYEFTSSSNSDFYSDGLRFAGFTEFS